MAANALGVDSCWIHRAKEVFETEYGKELKDKMGDTRIFMKVSDIVF